MFSPRNLAKETIRITESSEINYWAKQVRGQKIVDEISYNRIFCILALKSLLIENTYILLRS